MSFWLNLQVLVLDCMAKLICPEIYIIFKKVSRSILIKYSFCLKPDLKVKWMIN